MLATVTHILTETTIQRTRTLPIRGNVSVRVGQKVNAIDTIAEAIRPGRHILIDVQRALGLRDSAALQRLLERHEGDQLLKGDVIAQTGGVFSRVVRAPEDSHIISIQRGQVLLGLKGERIELKAGYAGTVVNVIPEYGAVIETSGALVQGVWGNNLSSAGSLEVLAKSPGYELSRSELDITLRGSIVLAGTCTQADALEAAAEMPVRGLILGSLTGDLVSIAQRQPYPIVLLEGFGQTPVNAAAFRLLTRSSKAEITLHAGWDAHLRQRPEIVIPQATDAKPARNKVEFKPGQTVKVLRPPYAGQVGTLTSIRPGLTSLPNGLRVSAADIQLENNEQVSVPLTNLAVLY